MKRVVITGRGVVTGLGNNLDALMKGIRGGKSSVRSMPDWDKYKGLHTRIGAVADIEDEKDIPRKNRRSMGRLSVFGAQAAKQAVTDAGISDELLSSSRFGCVMGSTMGGAEAMYEAFSIMIPNYDLSELSSMSFFKPL